MTQVEWRRLVKDAREGIHQFPPEVWRSELHAAGWQKRMGFVWADPNGKLYIGPFGAWIEMKRREVDK